MSKKYLLYITFIVLLIVGFFSCRSVDIRTTEVKQDFNTEKGTEVLKQMYQAHSAFLWDSIDTYSLHLTDEFYGIAGKFGNPFPKNKADFMFHAIPNTFTSKVIFQDKKWNGRVWGIQSWQTYSSKSNVIELDKKNDKNIEFWLPTYQYFIEIPNKIFEADIISYAGERTFNGKKYDLVFASWKTDNPQKDIDQYILWINQETHILELLHYTVRDEFQWLHATLKYLNYSSEKGIPFPTEMEVNLFGSERKKLLHKINIDNINVNLMPRDSLILFPDLRLTGKQ